jgi:hypothetical protein
MKIYFFLLILILFWILSIIEYKIDYQGLEKSGYLIKNNLLTESEVHYLLHYWNNKDYTSIKYFFKNNINMENTVTEIFGNDYILLDYTYIIEDSSIHTFHRDYTSCKQYNKLDNISYTMIIYLDSPDYGLDVIPESHNNIQSVYMMNSAISIRCDSGSAIIFDANLLHSGTLKVGQPSRHCIQFKIVHKDDISKIPHLLGQHVLNNRQNDKSYTLKQIERYLTQHFPIFMDMNNGIIKTSFSDNKTFMQKIVSSLVFSNQDFYKPIHI